MIKGQGTIARLIGMKLAKKNKKLFEQTALNRMSYILQLINCKKQSSYELVSYSSKNDFPEQLLSILSYLRYAGQPQKWHIYSDGSHTSDHTAYLKKYFPFVTLYSIDFNASDYPLRAELDPHRKTMIDYATKLPLGKKLLYFLNHSVHTPTIFLDSDILFYEKASELIYLDNQPGGWFLPDCVWGTLDPQYLATSPRLIYGVNSGFFKIDKNLDVSKGLRYLAGLNSAYSYFSEQTTIHQILLDNRLHALDPRVYFLNNSDQFSVGYNFKRNNIVLRHYTNPVRYKMWQRSWKWHLCVSD